MLFAASAAVIRNGAFRSLPPVARSIMTKSTSASSGETHICKADKQHVEEFGRKPKEPEAHDERLSRPPYKLGEEKEGKFEARYKGQVRKGCAPMEQVLK